MAHNYTCPACGSRSVNDLFGKNKKLALSALYYCRRCGATWGKPGPGQEETNWKQLDLFGKVSANVDDKQ